VQVIVEGSWLSPSLRILRRRDKCSQERSTPRRVSKYATVSKAAGADSPNAKDKGWIRM